MNLLCQLVVLLAWATANALAQNGVRIDIQWGTGNPMKQNLRSFQPESEFYDKLKRNPPFQETFYLETDRTHNRMKQACQQIRQPWTLEKDRETRDYLRQRGYVKAVRITQTPQPYPVTRSRPPFVHPYPRPVRGIAFYGNDNCRDEPALIIWPKLSEDMDYPTERRFEILKSENLVDRYFYKWGQPFEFSDFDVKKDPNSNHYNLARPKFWEALDPNKPEEIEKFLVTYQRSEYLSRDMLGSPMGTPYHQAFGSFREIFPTPADSVWRQIVSPEASDYSYWDIPMINVQLDHRNEAGDVIEDSFNSFVPYALIDSSRATVFEVIEKEYARFFKLMIDELGPPGKSPLKRLRWRKEGQRAALRTLAPYLDPVTFIPLQLAALQMQPKARKGVLADPDLLKLESWQLYTTSPVLANPKEWTLPPSFLQVPVWTNQGGPRVQNQQGQLVQLPGYEMVDNPNKIIYSSVQITYLADGTFTVQTVPVVSNPRLALQREAIVLLEQLPISRWLEGEPLDIQMLLGNSYLDPAPVIPVDQTDQIIPVDQAGQINPIIPVDQNQVNPVIPVNQNNQPSGEDLSVIEPQGEVVSTVLREGSPSAGLVQSDSSGTEADSVIEELLQAMNGIDSDAVTMGSISSLADSIAQGGGTRADMLDSPLMDTRQRANARSGAHNRPTLMDIVQPGMSAAQANALLQSRRLPSAREEAALRESVANFRPPQPQNLRENLLRASRHPQANGDIIVPVGDGGDSLLMSLVIKNTQPQALIRAGAPSDPLAPSRSSGTGKKGPCIHSQGPIGPNSCFGMVCCQK
ncbi:hypothetical protein DRE_06585 [Drechslerella stenobrocha 248]|uniref:Sulfatase-modifying factor enzyme domain-containing protein n=1 Tax=Drechslerella stenobrocha 248 TaxID=1043628 RepID=W7HNG1_9PEZI|nr:hypothetical protein DRE_06585 [Drechslerella stenobrocha 248]